MKPAALVLLALLVVQASNEVPVAQEPSHHLVLENQYTRVYQVEVLPGKATLLHRHDHDYVFVVLGDAHISNEVAGQPARDMQVKDGDVNFAKGGFAHVARNVGTMPFRNVTIEVLRKTTKENCLAPRDFCEHVTYGRASGASTLVDTDAVYVRRIEIAPRGRIRRYRHTVDHLLVAISDLHLKNDIVGKGPVDIRQKAGEVVWIKGGFEHTLTNVGTGPARFVAVEFK